MLTAAGFTVEDELTITVNIAGNRSETIGSYAHGSLQCIRGAAAPSLSAEDLAVRTERGVWAARRA